MSDVPDLPSSPPFAERPAQGVRAVVAADDAFCFHYADNTECMRASGIDVRTFSPVAGTLPDADIYFLGGGYPELYAEELSGNRDLMDGIRNASEEGKSVIGECGGMLTLCRGLTVSGKRHVMAGVFDAEARMTNVRRGPSYVIGTGTQDNPFFAGVPVRAHEFHYSDADVSGHRAGYELSRGTGTGGGTDGIVVRNTLCTFMHLHALSATDWCGHLLSVV
jgi:cobyrinic acid a,c-diamide synthase